MTALDDTNSRIDYRQARRAQDLQAQGTPVPKIASVLGCTTSHVYRLLKHAHADSSHRAELIAAARPWAQNPWSAKGGA